MLAAQPLHEHVELLVSLLFELLAQRRFAALHLSFNILELLKALLLSIFLELVQFLTMALLQGGQLNTVPLFHLRGVVACLLQGGGALFLLRRDSLLQEFVTRPRLLARRLLLPAPLREDPRRTLHALLASVS